MNDQSVDEAMRAENERSRRIFWSETKDVWDREYSNARKMGLEAAAASEHADDFYDKHFGLDPIAPDYSTALVQLALSPQLAVPQPSIDRRMTLDETRAAALQASQAASRVKFLTRAQLDEQSLPIARPGSNQERLDRLAAIKREQTADVSTAAPAHEVAEERRLQL